MHIRQKDFDLALADFNSVLEINPRVGGRGATKDLMINRKEALGMSPFSFIAMDLLLPMNHPP